MPHQWVRDHPKFLTLLTARVISRAGDVLYTLAATWSVLTTTHSILGASLIPLLNVVPDLVLALPLATLADRWSKKPLMVSMDFVRAAVVGTAGLLLLHGPMPPLALYALTLLLNVGALLFAQASSAMMRLTVPPDRLTDANGLWQSSLSVLSVVSFGVGGVLVALVSPARALLLDAMSFLVSGSVLAAVAWPDIRAAVSTGGFGFLSDALLGLRYFWDDAVLRRLLLLIAPVNVLFGPMLIFSAAFSNRVLHTGAVGFGIIEMAAGLGSIVAGLVVGWASRRASFTFWLFALLGSGALELAGSAFARNLWVTAGLYTVGWAVSGVFNIPFVSAVQRAVPAEQVGRVMQTLFLVASGVTVPLGLLLGSFGMDHWGVVRVLYLEAGCYGVVALAALVFPIQRQDPHPVFEAFGSRGPRADASGPQGAANRRG